MKTSRITDRRIGRAVIVAIAAAALVIVAGVATGIWFTGVRDSAEAGALRYLDAVTRGDAEAVRAALASGDTAFSAEAGRVFDAATVYPEIPRLVSAQARGDQVARIEAIYDLAGDERSVTFTMRQHEGRWYAEPDALGELEASTSVGDAVRIGTVVLPASDPVALPPAVYDVHPAPSDILTGSIQARVEPGQTARVMVEAAMASDAEERAQPALEQYLRTCTAPASTTPPSCGIRVSWGAELAAARAFAFRVERFPTLAFDATGGFLATGGVYTVTVTGETREGVTVDHTYRDEAWTLRGSVDFDGGEMILRAW